jgi:hypothetical protein
MDERGSLRNQYQINGPLNSGLGDSLGLEMEGAVRKLLQEPTFHPGHASTGFARNTEASLTERASRGALIIAKALSGDIGKGEMGKGEIHHPEAGGTGGFLTRTDSLAKEGQLEAILMSPFI